MRCISKQLPLEKLAGVAQFLLLYWHREEASGHSAYTLYSYNTQNRTNEGWREGTKKINVHDGVSDIIGIPPAWKAYTKPKERTVTPSPGSWSSDRRRFRFFAFHLLFFFLILLKLKYLQEMCKTLVFISFSSSSNDLFQSVHKAFVIFYILKRIKNCKSLILHPKITLKVSNEVNFFFFFFVLQFSTLAALFPPPTFISHDSSVRIERNGEEKKVVLWWWSRVSCLWSWRTPNIEIYTNYFGSLLVLGHFDALVKNWTGSTT